MRARVRACARDREEFRVDFYACSHINYFFHSHQSHRKRNTNIEQVFYHRREEGEPGSAEQEGTSNPENDAPLEAAANPVFEVRFSSSKSETPVCKWSPDISE